MKITKKDKDKVIVTRTQQNFVHLINIKTGEVDSKIPWTKTYYIELGEHYAYVRIEACSSYPGTTTISTNVNIRYRDEKDIKDIVTLLTVLEEHKVANKHLYDSVDLNSLTNEKTHRNSMRELVIKEEQKYTKKLLAKEVQRIAKENIDSRVPPVTDVLLSTTPLEITMKGDK